MLPARGIPPERATIFYEWWQEGPEQMSQTVLSGGWSFTRIISLKKAKKNQTKKRKGSRGRFLFAFVLSR